MIYVFDNDVIDLCIFMFLFPSFYHFYRVLTTWREFVKAHRSRWVPGLPGGVSGTALMILEEAYGTGARPFVYD